MNNLRGSLLETGKHPTDLRKRLLHHEDFLHFARLLDRILLL